MPTPRGGWLREKMRDDGRHDSPRGTAELAERLRFRPAGGDDVRPAARLLTEGAERLRDAEGEAAWPVPFPEADVRAALDRGELFVGEVAGTPVVTFMLLWDDHGYGERNHRSRATSTSWRSPAPPAARVLAGARFGGLRSGSSMRIGRWSGSTRSRRTHRSSASTGSMGSTRSGWSSPARPSAGESTSCWRLPRRLWPLMPRPAQGSV